MKKVCIKCGKILTGKQEKFCSKKCSNKCSNKYHNSINYKKHHEAHKKNPMLCPNCGRRKKYPLLKNCLKCLESSKKNKYKRVSMGLCISCGKFPIYKWNMCKKCYERTQLLKQTEKYKEKKRKIRRENYERMKIGGDLLPENLMPEDIKKQIKQGLYKTFSTGEGLNSHKSITFLLQESPYPLGVG